MAACVIPAADGSGMEPNQRQPPRQPTAPLRQPHGRARLPRRAGRHRAAAPGSGTGQARRGLQADALPQGQLPPLPANPVLCPVPAGCWQPPRSPCLCRGTAHWHHWDWCDAVRGCIPTVAAPGSTEPLPSCPAPSTACCLAGAKPRLCLEGLSIIPPHPTSPRCSRGDGAEARFPAVAPGLAVALLDN